MKTNISLFGTPTEGTIMSANKLSLAAEAYLYGYPLVYNLSEMINATTKPGLFAAPVNVFGHARELLGAETKFVSANNDTLYSIAVVDVSGEPQVLHLPDTDDRYYVMQFVDAWTNNFAYLGRRATGTQAGLYLLAGPGWRGETPDGTTLIEAPSSVFVIVGRYAVEQDDEDVATVGRLQDDTWLTPLSLYPERPDNSGRQLGDRDIFPYDKDVGGGLEFWEQFRSWMKLFPPPAAEREYVGRFESLGLLADASPYIDADPGLAKTLKSGKEECLAFISENMSQGEPVNGWKFSPHVFDYNLDYLGIGTLPDWVLDDRDKAHFIRAIAARVGLWGNHGYEANYLQTFVDDRGEELVGSRRYVLHFDEQPPVDAFWSITMYDVPDFYLSANPIDRYSIGDRTPGLNYNEDGSLDIYIQHEEPAADRRANWLPAPAGAFRPILRQYQPLPEALDGTWVVPPINRID